MSPEIRGLLAAVVLCLLIWHIRPTPATPKPKKRPRHETLVEHKRRVWAKPQP